ncbi:MAG TPA: hypothetical protein VIS99_14715 [Terrimicrobiaceae bacterium]
MRKRLGVILGWCLVVVASAQGDGGAIISRQTLNGLNVTVFASPAPVRAGPVDISVLVQRGQKPILDAGVNVTWRASSSSSPDWLPPCCTMESGTEKIPALRAHSNNKFLYSAIVPMKSAGLSALEIEVAQGDQKSLLSCEVEVLQPLPPALAFWPWLLFPPLAIAGFALHQSITKSREGSPK